jgi:hypothetical protein
MTFEEQGFLSDETKEIRRITRTTFAGTFAICERVNDLSHRVRNSIKLDYENQLHMVSICLLQRILDSFQSVVLLMEIGLEADSNTITRSSLEALFILRKLSLDQLYIEKYLGTDQLQRKKLINLVKEDKLSVLRESFTEQELDKRLAEILSDIQQHDLKKISIEQLAHETDLDQWYQLPYRVLSTDAHSLPRSLERYVDFDNKQDVVRFDFNPKTDRLEAILITEASIVLIALDAIERIFNCGFGEDIQNLHKSVVTRRSRDNFA